MADLRMIFLSSSLLLYSISLTTLSDIILIIDETSRVMVFVEHDLSFPVPLINRAVTYQYVVL